MKKLLIVQVRNNPIIRDHDAGAYVRVIGNEIAYDIKNSTESSIDLLDIEHYDGYIVGGSHYMTYEDFPGKEKLFNLTRYAVNARKPFLGICFGFEVLVDVLEGKVVHDALRKEFGTCELKLTTRGVEDPLFAGIPRKFLAQEAHESYVQDLPHDCVQLASGEQTYIQALRLGTGPVYGVQFHAELSKENMHERMRMYNNDPTITLVFTKEDFETIKDTKVTERVVTNFVSMI